MRILVSSIPHRSKGKSRADLHSSIRVLYAFDARDYLIFRSHVGSAAAQLCSVSFCSAESPYLWSSPVFHSHPLNGSIQHERCGPEPRHFACCDARCVWACLGILMTCVLTFGIELGIELLAWWNQTRVLTIVARKIPFDDPQTLNYVRVGYVSVQLLVLSTYYYISMKVCTLRLQ